MKVYASAFLFLYFFSIAFSQSPGNVIWPIVHETSPNQDDSANFGPGSFNFHPYRMFDQPNETWSLPTPGLDEVSAFVVFSSINPTHIFELRRTSLTTMVSDSTLISYDTIHYQETDWHPKFLTYIESSPYGGLQLYDSTYLAFGSAETNLDGFQGGVAEVLLYPYLLDADQRNRVESYLSLKYGISLPDSSNYVRSDGDSLWLAEAHQIYRHRVTGIGRDDQGALYQKQSHNLYGDLDLTIGLESIETYNSLNAGTIADKSYLLWADNDSLASFTPLDPDTPEVKLMQRIWEAFAIGGDIRTKSFQVRMDTTGIVGFDSSLDLFLVRQDNAGIPLNLAACDFYTMIDDGNGTYSCTVTFDSDQSGSDLFGFYQQPMTSSQFSVKDIVCSNRGINVQVLVAGDSDKPLQVQLFKEDKIMRSGFGRPGEPILFRDLPLGTYEIMSVPDWGVSTRQTLYLDEAYCLESRTFGSQGALTPNPVPANQPFRLVFQSSMDQELLVTIYSQSGNLVGKQRIFCSGGCLYSGLIERSGTYLVKVEGKEGFQEVYPLVVIEE